MLVIWSANTLTVLLMEDNSICKKQAKTLIVKKCKIVLKFTLKGISTDLAILVLQ